MKRPKRKGISAAAWFYSQSFHNHGALALNPTEPISTGSSDLAAPRVVQNITIEPPSAEEKYLVSRTEREEQIELEIRAEQDYELRAEEWDALHPELRCPPRE